MPDPVDEDANGESRTSRPQLVIAEYQTVAGLIEYFRDVEMKALAGAGLVLSVVGAGYATLEAESDTNEHAQAILLVAAAWVCAVLLLVVLMATVRGFRAMAYMHDRVHPLAEDLTRDDRYLAYEVHADCVFVVTLERQRANRETWLPVDRIAPWFVPGRPIMLLIWLASVSLATLGAVRRPDVVTILLGASAAIVAIAFLGLRG